MGGGNRRTAILYRRGIGKIGRCLPRFVLPAGEECVAVNRQIRAGGLRFKTYIVQVEEIGTAGDAAHLLDAHRIDCGQATIFGLKGTQRYCCHLPGIRITVQATTAQIVAQWRLPRHITGGIEREDFIALIGPIVRPAVNREPQHILILQRKRKRILPLIVERAKDDATIPLKAHGQRKGTGTAHATLVDNFAAVGGEQRTVALVAIEPEVISVVDHRLACDNRRRDCLE